jgi:CspA family cold shock protein
MAHGTIKRVFADRGFGFISTNDGSDLFFHISELVGDAAERAHLFQELSEGQGVSYLVGQGQKGPVAINVARLSHAPTDDGETEWPTPESYAMTRNATEEFSRRVRKNLDFIISQRSAGADVHEVTQLTISLLGLIIFPWESSALHTLEDSLLEDLENEGWPRWEIVRDRNGETTSLGKLTYHLRNAAAHRRIRFSSDDPYLRHVIIEFEDAKPNQPVDWLARIPASDLKDFCDRFSSRIEGMVG